MKNTKYEQMKTYFFLGMAFLLTTKAFSQETGSLTVNIDVVKDQGKGQLVFMLFDQENGFPKEVDKAKYKAIVQEVKAKTSYTFEDIPYGEYAICVFHDTNENGEIDTNFMGMPKEHVAASNMTGLGKPTFKKSEIAIFKPEKTFTLDFIND